MMSCCSLSLPAALLKSCNLLSFSRRSLGCQRSLKYHLVKSNSLGRQRKSRSLMESAVASAGTAAVSLSTFIGRRKCSSTSTLSSTLSLFSVIFHLYLLLIFLLSFIGISNSSSILAANSVVPASSSSTPSLPPTCIIGRLRECNDDEDCFEDPALSAAKPEVRVIVSSVAQNGTSVDEQVVHSHTFLSKSTDPVSGRSSYQRVGTCTCRQADNCTRTREAKQTRESSLSSTSKNDKRSTNDKNNNKDNGRGASWTLYTLSGLVLLFGGCAFSVYFYGFRYELVYRIARHLGLTDTTQIEHQLLNRIPSSAAMAVEDGAVESAVVFG